MAREWTDDQRLAIETRDKTLLVSAAAGSGKTAVLTERIVRSLLDEAHPADLSRMLIVTFTKAAAAEMRSRITAAVKSALGERPEDTHLEEQLLLIDSANICTIDAFCAAFLRRHARAAGISPRFRIADEAESEILSRMVWTSLLDDCYKNERTEEVLPVREDFLLLCDSLTTVRDADSLVSHLSELSKKCDSLFNGIHTLRTYAEDMQSEAAKDYPSTAAFAAIADHLKLGCLHFKDAYKRVLDCRPTVNESRFSFLSAKGTLFGRLAEALETRDLSAVRTLLTDELWKKSLPTRKGESDPLTKALNDAANKFKNEEILTLTVFGDEDWKIEAPRLARVLRALATLSEAFDARYTKAKRAKNMLTYADVERLTLDLLWDEQGASSLALAERALYDYIYIDEYQDVSEVQHRIFDLLSNERNRFMVGDIKQSIYRFRGGEPSLFADLRAAFDLPPITAEGDAYTVFMSKNFRCDPPIISFTNAVFDCVFGIAGESIGYRNEDRLDRGKLIEGEDKCAPVDIYLAHDETGEIGDLRQREATAIFLRIKDLLKNGKNRDGTSIMPKDIAVLLRSVRHSCAGNLSALLTQAGIPCTVPEDTDFFLSPEVLLLLCLLHSIDNPRRDVYLAGLLRSPLCRFTLNELVRIRAEGKKGSCLYEALCAYAEKHPADEKCARTLAMLDGYAAYAEGTSVSSLLSRIFDETAIFTLSGIHSGRENLQLFYHHARNFEGSGFKGLYAFLTYIDRLIREGKHLPADKEAVIEASGVRIITVHASKGLEFPVVILGECAKAASGSCADAILHDKHVGVAMRLCTDDRYAVCDNPLYTAARLKSERADREENLRLLYVALTRATERLLLVGHIGKRLPSELVLGGEIKPDLYSVLNAPSYLSLALLALGFTAEEDALDTTAGELLLAKNDFCRLLYCRMSETSAPTEANASTCAKANGEESAPALPSDEELRARFDFIYPHDAATALPAKLSVSRLVPDLLDGENEVEWKPPAEEAETEKMRTKPRFLLDAEAANAAARGSATHLFLQFCDFSRLAEDAESELRRLTETGFLTAADADLVRLNEIKAMTRSRLFADTLKAARIHRELRFHAYLPAAYFTEDEKKRRVLAGETVFVQGVIDCVLVYGDGSYDLIDYKTDRLPKSREEAEALLRARHTLQLSYYAEACERMFGAPPRSLRLYSLALGEDLLLERRIFPSE